ENVNPTLLLLFEMFIWVCLSLAELRCPGLDWLEFGEFCYKPFGDRKTWQDAQRVCRDLGAELVSIMSMKEQSWVESYFYMGKALEKTTNNLWTGLNDLLVPGMFTWSDDFEVTFTYWAPGEPNNHNGFSEDCEANDAECQHYLQQTLTLLVHFCYIPDRPME
uniref:C-type lectin domain-containing protein n=1 Tax=Oryzias latipes TaxID=8090 RepID=A0A3P9HN46_ORYLA